MTIQEIYEKYEIPQNLQEHHLRVTGIAKIIAESWVGKALDRELLIRTCLLHDMGNIVKFDLSDETAKKFHIDNVETLRETQKRFWQKYGKDAHKATVAICNELGLPEVGKAVEDEFALYMDPSGAIVDSQQWEIKIFYYGDFRVMPQGVVSLQERVDDLARRYHTPQEILDRAFTVEQQLEERTSRTIATISEEDVTPYFSELLSGTL